MNEVIASCEEWVALPTADRVFRAMIGRYLGLFYAMTLRTDEAVEALEESSQVLDELNELIASMLYRRGAAEARALVGDFAGAERDLLARWSYFEAAGSRTRLWAIDTAVALSTVYCDEGRWDEAERMAASVRDAPLNAPNAVDVAAKRLAVEARLAARQGRYDEAVAFAEQAAASVAPDRLEDRGVFWQVLADVERAAGRTEAAAASATTAIGLFEAKGNLTGAARARALLS